MGIALSMTTSQIIGAYIVICFPIGAIIYLFIQHAEDREDIPRKVLSLAVAGVLVFLFHYYFLFSMLSFEDPRWVVKVLIWTYLIVGSIMVSVVLAVVISSFKEFVYETFWGTLYNLHAYVGIVLAIPVAILFLGLGSIPFRWFQNAPAWTGMIPFAFATLGFYLGFEGYYRIRPFFIEFSIKTKAKLFSKQYVLLLRSFRDREGREAPDDFAWTYGPDGMDYQMQKGRSMITDLTKALSGVLPVVSISRYQFKNTVDLAHAIQLYSTDENWFETYRLMADGAKSIVIIPGDSEGLWDEITVIMNSDLRKKAMVFQPPKMETEFDSNASQVWESYQAFTERMKKEFNVEFPRFSSNGLFICLDKQQNLVSTSIPDSSVFTLYRSIRKAYNNISPQLSSPDARSFNEVNRERKEINELQ